MSPRTTCCPRGSTWTPRASTLTLSIDHQVAVVPEHIGETIGQYYLKALQSIAAQPESRYEGVSLLPESESRRLLKHWNDTGVEYPRDRCVHELFAEQVRRTPNAVALVTETQEISYAQLDRDANRLAHYLRGMGVGPQQVVGLCTERSSATVIGLLGILKAGAVYLPLDPQHPADRLAFILDDTRAALVLTTEPLVLPGQGRRIVQLEEIAASLSCQPENEAPGSAVGANDLAYIIYTSGSTGLPKGVAVEHRAFINHMSWQQGSFALSDQDRMLQKTALSFDASLTELLWPLCYGAALVLARPRGEQDPEYVVQALREQRITVLQLVPSLLRALVNEAGLKDCTSLRQIICAGEELSRELPRQLKACLPGVRTPQSLRSNRSGDRRVGLGV